MIIVDTSVWVDHLRNDEPDLIALLENQQVLCHPFVIGELACGNLANRENVIPLLQNLPRSVIAADEEVLSFIEANNLMGIGIGYIGAHLLASTRLGLARNIWSRDKQLHKAAIELELEFTIAH
ncbi:MAG: VapC toxin family PIN domain ribonuclease [Granulosicoccaceae bacterium]